MATNPNQSGPIDSEAWTCSGCGGQMIGSRTPDNLCGPCIAARLSRPVIGPFDSERQARETQAVRAVYLAFEADPGQGKMAQHNRRILCEAIDAAGVQLGQYDERIVTWLAGFGPECAAATARQLGGAS